MSVVRLALGDAVSVPFNLERASGVVRLTDSTSGINLRIGPNRAVDMKDGARGPWAQFIEERIASASGVRLKSVGHQRLQGSSVYLTATPDSQGGLRFGSASHEADATIFEISPVASSSAPSTHCDSPPPPSPPTYVLTPEQRASFATDGFLILRGLVPRSLVDEALRVINSSLPLSHAWEHGETEDGRYQFGKGLANQPMIQDLLTSSPLLNVAEQLLGRLDRSDAFGGQIALRFPLSSGASELRGPKQDDQWHIDGMKKTPEHMSPFQLLAGVALSDQTSADCGNVHMWRGQHEVTFEAVRAQRDARRRRCHVPTELGSRGDTSHPPSVDDPWLGLKPVLPPEARVQPQLEAGDVILAHQKLPHSIGLNRSPHVRYQVYFRLKSASFRPDEPPTSLWHGWSGMDLQETHMETQADAPTQSNDLPMDHDQHQASMDVQ